MESTPKPGREVLNTFVVAFSVLMAFGCAKLDTLMPALSADGEISGRVVFAVAEGASPDSATHDASRQGPVLIYLEAINERPTGGENLQVEEIMIRDGRQEPEIHLVRPGQPWRIRNLDSIYHELFTADLHNRFEVRVEGGQASQSIRLTDPGFVRIFCKLHPRETYALIVSETENFILLERGSHFAIPSVPAGDYLVHAATVGSQSERLSVRIEANEIVDLTLRLSPRSLQ